MKIFTNTILNYQMNFCASKNQHYLLSHKIINILKYKNYINSTYIYIYI